MDEVATFAREPFKQVSKKLLLPMIFPPVLNIIGFCLNLQLLTDFQVDIAIPEVFVGGLLGSMLIYLFSAWACSAVGRTAQEVVREVRRQFIERPGIMVSITSPSNFHVNHNFYKVKLMSSQLQQTILVSYVPFKYIFNHLTDYKKYISL